MLCPNCGRRGPAPSYQQRWCDDCWIPYHRKRERARARAHRRLARKYRGVYERLYEEEWNRA